MSKRREERARLGQLIEENGGSWMGYHDKQRLITALLDNGYRSNALLLQEEAANLQKFDPANPVMWLRHRARDLEGTY